MNDAVFDAESSLYVLIRFVQYVGLLLLIGVVTGDRLLARTPTLRTFVSANGVFVDEARRRARHLGVVGLGIIAISMGLRLIAQAYAINGGEGWIRLSRLGAATGAIGNPCHHPLWQQTRQACRSAIM